ncbi:MAG: Epsin-3, clathrin recruitment and traffic between the Golgi and endosome [Caeruleum heppii]|nr:MAG: Epsin-3, clathrin recruitment and traffic between the Golgi and endosome [Caeruleum heppii]
MDFNSLKDQVSNLTLYDLKAGVRKVQNAVMNYTEMEAKVREATNNDPWGTGTTVMQEIANGTYNYSLLNEIMPMIYKRFTEKSAEEWRQIYKVRLSSQKRQVIVTDVDNKALQLLEFLVKNGSERVIDDARSHLSLLKMLRQFHYIDEKGKDQGINVRNRSKELAELLSDVDRIRAERKKARATRGKYQGVEGGRTFSSSGSGSRYGGFGSGDGGYGGYSGGVYGDGGGFGGNASGFQDSSSRRERFEEYDEYDEGAPTSSRRTDTSSKPASSRKEEASKKTEPPKKKEPEVDLFSFGDEDITPAPSTAIGATSNGKQPSTSTSSTLQNSTAEDDDFDDFQSATPTTSAPSISSAPVVSQPPMTSSTLPPSAIAAPKPVSASQGANLTDLVGFASISPAPSNTTTPSQPSAFSPPPINQGPPKPAGYQAATPNYFTSVSVTPNATQSHPNTSGLGGATASSTTPSSLNKPASTAKAASSSGDAFGSIWSTASVGVKKSNASGQSGPNLASMAKEKASAGIWGATTPAVSQQKPLQQSQGLRHSGGQSTGGGASDDLLG